MSTIDQARQHIYEASQALYEAADKELEGSMRRWVSIQLMHELVQYAKTLNHHWNEAELTDKMQDMALIGGLGADEIASRLDMPISRVAQRLEDADNVKDILSNELIQQYKNK